MIRFLLTVIGLAAILGSEVVIADDFKPIYARSANALVNLLGVSKVEKLKCGWSNNNRVIDSWCRYRKIDKNVRLVGSSADQVIMLLMMAKVDLEPIAPKDSILQTPALNIDCQTRTDDDSSPVLICKLDTL